jgi:DNA-nicking Smr family endonuclease
MAKPDDEDTRLFREAVKGVRPLRERVVQESLAAAPRPRPQARFTRADRLAVLRESLTLEVDDPALAGGEALLFQREGISPAVVRKLRRGQYRVQAEIDLHGLTVAQAKEALRSFLAESLERHMRCVRIIHGKGLRSGHRGPVLKSTVSSVLRRVGRVLAFVSARQVDGGTGAVYVLLADWTLPPRG